VAGLLENAFSENTHLLVMRFLAGLFRVTHVGDEVEDFTQSPDQTQDHSDEDWHHDGSEKQTF
jgi:hypothetical protein